MTYHPSSEIKTVTVVGSGNAFNTDGRAHSAYLLETSSGKFFLIDAGPTTLYRLRQMNFSSDRIDCILFSHFHGDHMGGLPFILLDMDIVCKKKDDVVIIGPEEIEIKWKAWYELAYSGHRLAFHIKTVELNPEKKDHEIFIDGLQIKAMKITHRPESIGFRIEDSAGKSFAYSGDSAFDQNVLDLVSNTDVAVIELSMDAQSSPPTPHISLEELEHSEIKLNTKRLILSHTTDDIAEKAKLINAGETAYDGMVIKFME